MAETRIGVIGCAGRVGRMLIADIVAAEGCALAGGIARKGSITIGQDTGELYYTSRRTYDVPAARESRAVPQCADRPRRMHVNTRDPARPYEGVSLMAYVDQATSDVVRITTPLS